MKFVRSWESGKVKKLGWQSNLILCTAIYAIRRQGEPEPSRKRVLTYIRVGRLVAWEALGPDLWTDEEHTWIQFFSWCREDAATEGLLAYSGSIDRGTWRLSDKGREFVHHFADKWFKLGKTPERIEADLHAAFHVVIFSKQFVKLLLSIGEERQVKQAT